MTYEIRKKAEEVLERKIRNDYKGILSETQIEATIQWWKGYVEVFYERMDELEEKSLELTQALDTAHKIFGSESDKWGEIVKELEARLEKAVEAFKEVSRYSNGCGCCADESVQDNEKVKEFLKINP